MTTLLASLTSKFVTWLNSQEDFQRVMIDLQNFRPQKPFPNVIGCVDATHISIPAPKIDGKSYLNRKGSHSMILQGVCDSMSRFLDVFFGFPGRSHDAWVWRNSPLGRKFESGELLIPDGSYLLGDSAYTLNEYLIVPFKDNGFLSPVEKNFNFHHSSTRVCIEQAFGILKGKFRILKYLPIYKLKNAKKIVLSCIVLHNIIIHHQGVDTEEIYSDEQNETYENDYINQTSSTNQAKERRQALAQLFVA